MSYSQPYSIEVPFSGSKSVSFPKSDSGGTMNVSYSGTTSAEIVIHVDTRPLDSSVSRVNGHVDALTGAVVAMNTAQVVAINQTAKEVSNSLLNGFFGTIKAEISQQLQALDSAIKATFGLILEQGKAVTQKKGQMETDFNRISSRYADLFGNLDAECHKRIYELDKPAFNLSEKIQKKLINETISGEGAKNFIFVNEEASSKIMFLASSLLRKVFDVIKTLHNYINQEIHLAALIDSFVENENVKEKVALLIPVIFAESDALEGSGGGGQNYDCFLSGVVSDKEKTIISERISAYCRNEVSSCWKDPEEIDKELLDKEFRLLVETEFAEDTDTSGNTANKRRIYDNMMNLWNNRDFLTLFNDRSRT
jgi:hypothetical protein